MKKVLKKTKKQVFGKVSLYTNESCAENDQIQLFGGNCC